MCLKGSNLPVQFHGCLAILFGRHSDGGLKHLVESGHGTEPDFRGNDLERYVLFRVVQQADGFIQPVLVDVLGKCLSGLLVDGLRQIGAVGVEKFRRFVLGQLVVLVDASVAHQLFQLLK